jgi:hypothetical protein
MFDTIPSEPNDEDLKEPLRDLAKFTLEATFGGPVNEPECKRPDDETPPEEAKLLVRDIDDPDGTLTTGGGA